MGDDGRANPSDALVAAAEAARADVRRGDAGRDYQIIRFAAADRPLALPIDAVERLERVPSVTAVPRTPPWVLGVASLRGGIVTIVDLRRLLTGEDPPGQAEPRSLVIVQDGKRRMGVLSTSLPDFERVRQDDQVKPPVAEADVYEGAVERDHDLVGILDPLKLFDHVEKALGDGGA